MRRLSLIALLLVFAVAVACSDSTGPSTAVRVDQLYEQACRLADTGTSQTPNMGSPYYPRCTMFALLLAAPASGAEVSPVQVVTSSGVENWHAVVVAEADTSGGTVGDSSFFLVAYSDAHATIALVSVEDMGNDPRREASVCGHVPIGTVDHTNDEELEDVYAARHNPFVYWHAIIDTPLCDSIVSLAPLEQDLKSIATTPNYVWITPNVCHDGHDAPCLDGAPGGLKSANRWLSEYIPLILNSPAFKQDGLLIIITDEGSTSEACCNERPGPNEKLPGVSGPGGGRIGAVAISRFIRPGTVSNVPYNHYSLVRSVFDIFHLDRFGQHYLGYAGQPGLVSFGADVFTNPTGAASTFAALSH